MRTSECTSGFQSWNPAPHWVSRSSESIELGSWVAFTPFSDTNINSSCHLLAYNTEKANVHVFQHRSPPTMRPQGHSEPCKLTGHTQSWCTLQIKQNYDNDLKSCTKPSCSVFDISLHCLEQILQRSTNDLADRADALNTFHILSFQLSKAKSWLEMHCFINSIQNHQFIPACSDALVRDWSTFILMLSIVIIYRNLFLGSQLLLLFEISWKSGTKMWKPIS